MPEPAKVLSHNRGRCWCFFWIILLLIFAEAAIAQPQFTWTTNLDNTITITGCTVSNTDVTIPDTIAGLPVTAVGAFAFYFRSDLTGVTMGTNLLSIGKDAFHACFNLSTLNIPQSVTNIESSAFGACWSLTNVLLPDSLTSIGSSWFLECYSLPTIKIPNNVTNVGDQAFGLCTNLNKVIIPDSVLSIDRGAFGGCLNLTNVTFGTHVTSFGQGAFSGCRSLTSFTWPYSVTNIGVGVFDGCSGLTNITVPDGISNIPDLSFLDCTGLQSITMPNGITNIGYLAFSNCRQLLSLTIPSGVRSIGNGAFEGCTELSYMTIPSSVRAIGRAFQGCNILSSMFFEGDAPSIDPSAFFGDNSTIVYYFAGRSGWGSTFAGRPTWLWDPEVPYRYSTTNGTVIIAGYVSGYTNSPPPSELVIPGTINGLPVTTIGSLAFYYATNLRSVTIPNSVKFIDNSSFFDCANLVGVYFLGNPPSADFSAFSGDFRSTVYYLPSSSGWTSSFYGIPTALWPLRYPFILNGNLSLSSSPFGFSVAWATNLSIVVEATTNLASPVWTALSTNALSNGYFHFKDRQWTNYPSRFYRVRSQ